MPFSNGTLYHSFYRNVPENIGDQMPVQTLFASLELSKTICHNNKHVHVRRLFEVTN